MKNINIKARVIEIKEVKEFEKFGKKGKLAIAVIETKEKKRYFLNLWDEQIDYIKKGTHRNNKRLFQTI
ncbi:MAG: hypothetical protein QXE31_03035 [Candidatus Woesearchaeota archaeon]